MLFVAGLAKSGKTLILNAVLREFSAVRHLIASDLLREGGGSLTPMHGSQVDANQRIILERLGEAANTRGDRVVVDGHFVIEAADGVMDVPDWFFAGLPLVGAIVIWDAADSLAERRKGTRFTTDIARIAELQRRETNRAAHVARHLGIPLSHVRSGDMPIMRAVVSRLLDLEGSR